MASWRAGGGRAGRARVALVAVVQVTPHLHLLPALGSDLLPDLSASASALQGSSSLSQGDRVGQQGAPGVEEFKFKQVVGMHLWPGSTTTCGMLINHMHI